MDYTYDLVSKITSVNDSTGSYAFAYDAMGRLTATTTNYAFLTSRSFTTAYTYDKASNRTGFTDPENGSTTYACDTGCGLYLEPAMKINRLQTLTPPSAFGTGNFGFSYDALSRRTQMTRPNNVTTNYTYDNLSRLLSVLHQLAGSTIDGATYTVDNGGNRTSKTDNRTGTVSNYGYDAIYELTNVTQGTNTTESYTYDPVGNRLSSLGVSPYNVNTSNELTSTPNASYTYDNNGNTLTKTDSTGTTQYAWDFENRLTSVTLPGSGGTVSFAYDPFGRRVKKSSASNMSIYSYDWDNLVEEANSSGGVVARYIQTENVDEPLAMLRSGGTSSYNIDGLGTVTSLASSSGALAQMYSFDSFGTTTASSGSLVNSLQYTGREFDSETGLYFYRARYYDRSVGRFLSEDPLRSDGGSPNFYGYVDNGSSNWNDPYGTDKLKKYHCDLFGNCSKRPFGTHKKAKPLGCPCKDGIRLPDFYNFALNVGIPQTGNLFGFTGSVSLDRYGRIYAGPGGNFGKSLAQASVSLTANYINAKCKPDPLTLDLYLSNENVTAGAGFISGLQYGGWPGSGTATGAGFVSPQAGVSGTYSWQVYQNKNWSW